MSSSPLEKIRPFRNFLGIFGSIGLAVAWALSTVDEPLAASPDVDASPLGYTISLALFLVPLGVLGWWFYRHPECEHPKRAFRWTLLILVPLGFVLDLLFANTFFRFPNHGATLGQCADASGAPLPWEEASLLCVPARGGVVPIEEFIFYLSGFMVVLLAYIWCDEHWLSRYKAAQYVKPAGGLRGLIHFHAGALALGVALVVAAFVLRKLVGGKIEGGFPGYACFLVAGAIVPSVGFFHTARPFINWRAFSFTFALIVLVSLIWEATLALPYGWWGYNDRWMVGVFIEPWFRLPIEAVFVWCAVTFSTVITFEVVKLWLSPDDAGQ